MKTLGAIIALLIVSGAAFAAQTVRIGSALYVCQNMCVVTADSGGRLSVSDSRGGWVSARYEGPVEVEMPADP